MRCRTLPFGLAYLLFSLPLACSASKEPPAIVAYVNHRTRECGTFQVGLRNEERTPIDPGFESMRLPWKPDECRQLLDRVLAYPEDSKTPSKDVLGEAATRPPCERLASSVPTSPEHACKALGYRYVGALPWSSRPCYPNLAPFLGARCAPLIWIHLAVLIAVAAFLAGVGSVIVKRRTARRRALATAAAGAAKPCETTCSDRCAEDRI